jgi:hypothetical protein
MSENNLEQWTQIEPIYFCLASFGRSIERKDIGDDWEEVLHYNEITAEDFDRYEKWWFSPDGIALVEKLKSKLINSIIKTVPSDKQTSVETVLEESNWRDFISELSGIFIEGSEDFLEYAVQDGLLSKLDESDLNEHKLGREELLALLQNWFDTKSEAAQDILLESHSVLIHLQSE